MVNAEQFQSKKLLFSNLVKAYQPTPENYFYYGDLYLQLKSWILQSAQKGITADEKENTPQPN
jgi:hypothetical protein